MIIYILHFIITLLQAFFFVIFQQLKSQISEIDQYGVNPFCRNETFHLVNMFIAGLVIEKGLCALCVYLEA